MTNPATTFDPQQFKMATREQWDHHAKGWNGQGPLIRAWLRDATDAMIEMAGIKPGMRVLDVAAGAGDQTLDIARRVGSQGSVLATDLSPAILEFAKENAERAGFQNVRTQAQDGEHLSVEAGSFDAAICRLGLMFFPNPETGLQCILRALKPGGRACTMVFSTPETNPCVSILVATALKHAGMPPRDPYQPGGLLSLGKPGLIDNLFRTAGFSDVATTKITATFRLPSVKDYLDFVRSSASPINQILRRADNATRNKAWDEIESKLSAFNTLSGWEGPNELMLTVGCRRN
jgi:SAM-dependent methyltransferase